MDEGIFWRNYWRIWGLNALLRENNRITAIATEGAGVARSVEHQDSVLRLLEVRWISYYADHKKNDDWQLYSANAADAFVIGFLRPGPKNTKGINAWIVNNMRDNGGSSAGDW